MDLTPVEVIAMFKKGKVYPQSIVWEDVTYPVECLMHMTRMSDAKYGGTGWRYTCMIDGKLSYLYFDDDGWYVEIVGR